MDLPSTADASTPTPARPDPHCSELGTVLCSPSHRSKAEDFMTARTEGMTWLLTAIWLRVEAYKSVTAEKGL